MADTLFLAGGDVLDASQYRENILAKATPYK